MAITVEDKRRFHSYHQHISSFVATVLAAEEIVPEDHVLGSQRVEYYLPSNPQNVRIYDSKEDPDTGGLSYEESLYRRVITDTKFNMLVLIGGLGSGKSTAIRHLLRSIRGKKTEVDSQYPCHCAGCARRPIVVDLLRERKNAPLKRVFVDTLRNLRWKVYERLLEEWYEHCGIRQEDVTRIFGAEKTLRRLLITNDIYRWADVERASQFPIGLRSAGLDLGGALLDERWSEGDVKAVVDLYLGEADKLAAGFVAIDEDVERALAFTALVVGFYLERCRSTKPANLFVIDNVDQMPTEFIEKLVYYLHDLVTRNQGMRMLVPLRPSSIQPHGFVRSLQYMYHYGPNCFDMMLHRIEKYVLMRSRSYLENPTAGDKYHPFTKAPTNEELTCFLVASYLYAMVLRGGNGGSGEHLHSPIGLRPEIHDDHAFLRRMRVSPVAIRHLSETLGAIVGTSARYATEQVQRYFYEMYATGEFLKEALDHGWSQGAAHGGALRFGAFVDVILGRWDGDSGHTGLANLFRPTTVTVNHDLPTLAKIRTLAFLSSRPRARVLSVVQSLAQYGIPVEIAIDALNDLHKKDRLLVWFSRNSDLQVTDENLDQDVVISEHGLTYLRHLIGDFEYVWFCAQDIPKRSFESAATFRERLDDYRRITKDLGRTEAKQLGFLASSSKTVWNESDVVTRAEMMTLLVLYSSLERAVSGAGVALARVTERGRHYQKDVMETLLSICHSILDWQAFYRRYYGGNGYLLLYKERISAARTALRRLQLKYVHDDALKEAISSVMSEWAEVPYQQKVEILPAERWDSDAIARAAAYGRGFLPAVQKALANLDRVEARNVGLGKYLQLRSEVAEILTNRIPVYFLMQQKIGILLEEAASVAAAARQIAATGPDLLSWLESERLFWREADATLKANEFEIPEICSADVMDGLKRRSNNILEVTARVARFLTGDDSWQHRLLWQ